MLIDAAEEVLDETGSTAISVEAIVSRAGFTRGAFYSNFHTVDELFFAVYEQQAERVFGILTQTLQDAFTMPHPSVEAVVHSVVRGLRPEEKWYATRAVLLTRARRDPDVHTLLRAHMDRFHATVQPLLIDALRRVHLAPTMDDAIFTRAIMAAHAGAVSQCMLFEATDAVRVAAVKGCILGLTATITDAT